MQTFKLGDTVHVKSGRHASLRGKVEDINRAKSLLKVAREVLGPKPAEGLFVLESVSAKFSEAEKVPPV